MKKGLSLQQLAELSGSQLEGDPQYQIAGVGDILSAKPDQITFLVNLRYRKNLDKSKAGAVILAPDLPRVKGKNYLIHKNPNEAFQTILEAISQLFPSNSSAFQGIHPSAIIAKTAEIGNEVTIGPNVVVDAHSKIGDRTFIGAGSFIGKAVAIGEDCYIHPTVTIRWGCCLGSRVIIQSNSVIGCFGFGYTLDPEEGHKRIEQLGIVEIENDVEIGPNCSIDRARFGTTKIGSGSKLGSYILLSHNAIIGKHCILVGRVTIAGSTQIGDHVMIGGDVAIDGHLEIASNTKIAARSGVIKSITKPGVYSGAPAYPIQEFNRMMVHLKNLPRIVSEMKTLKQRLSQGWLSRLFFS